MKSILLNFPDKMADYINNRSIDDITEFKRAAFLLYAYIDAGMLSYGAAAELLGVDKFKLIDFYGGYGIPYVDYDLDTYAESEKKLNDYYAAMRD